MDPIVKDIYMELVHRIDGDIIHVELVISGYAGLEYRLEPEEARLLKFLRKYNAKGFVNNSASK